MHHVHIQFISIKNMPLFLSLSATFPPPPWRHLQHSVCQTSVCWIQMSLFSVHLSSLCPVGAVVHYFLLCFMCCIEESYLIMKHREKHKGICSAPQILKFPLWPWQCLGAQKYFITSVGTSPDHPLDFKLGFNENLFSFSMSRRKSYWTFYERHFIIVILPSELFESHHFD